MEYLPPWLRNLPLPPRPAADDMPDWLRGVTSSASPAPGTSPPAAPVSEPVDNTPDWLRELQSEIGAAPTGVTNLPGRSPRGDVDDAPDWLRDVASVEPVAPARPAPADAPEPEPEPPTTTTTSRIRMPVGATDWLRSIGQEPDPANPKVPRRPMSEMIDAQSGVPDWLRDVNPGDLESEPLPDSAAAAPPAQMAFDPLASNWLTDASDTTNDDRTILADWAGDASAAAETVAATDVPDWLRDVAPASLDSPADQGRPRDSGSIPDWLSGSDRAGSSAPLAGADVPDWLRDVSGADASSDNAGPSWLDGPAATTPAPDVDVPDWLRAPDVAAPSSRGAQGAPPPPADEEAPAWLRDVEAHPVPLPAPAGEAEDVPAWLRDEMGERPAPTPPDEAEDVPAWLRDEMGERPAPAPTGGAEDVPAWLRDEMGERPAPPPTGGAEDVPAWLRDAGERPAPPPTGGAKDVPAWLRDAGERPAPPPLGGAEDMPAWLRDAEAETVSGNMVDATSAASAPAPAPADDVPMWLREASGPPNSGVPTAPPPPQAAPQDLPPWLAAPSAETAASPDLSATGDMSLPSWLRGVADESPPARTPVRSPKPDDMPPQPRRRAPTNEDAEGDDFFKGAELPGWLRPSEAEPPVGSPEGQALGWLTRLGASDDSEGEIVAGAAQPTARSAAPARRLYQRSPEQMNAVALLGQLARSPYPAPIASPVPTPLPRWQRIGLDRVLYALLAIMLLVGILAPQIAAPLQIAAPTAPGAADLAQRLASLGPDDVVMIAYEWDAQRSAELRPLEQAVTSQLIGHKTKLILLSTDIQGTLLSFDLRGPLRAASYNIDPDGKVFGGRDYVLLGYRPGGEMALRLLSQDLRAELGSDFEGRDATQGLLATNLDGQPRVSTISDLSMIIVLADQPQDVQVWMEQVHSAAPEVPVAFLMPQESEPMVQPYLRLPNVYHLAGMQGAMALNALTAETDGAAIAQGTGQQSLSVLTFVVLLIGGGLGLALAHARRSRRGAA